MTSHVVESLPQEFWCPFPSEIHPWIAEIERRTLDWAGQFGLVDSANDRMLLASAASADFYGRFAPHGSFDGLLLAACWVCWGFAFDDMRCDSGLLSTDPAAFAQYSLHLQRVLEVPHPMVADPFAAALRDIGIQARKLASPVKNRRFYEAHRSWLFGVQCQIANQSKEEIPSLDGYILMRLHSAGGEPTFALLEIANGLPDIPESELGTPEIRALTEMAILVASLDNDRHSFAREVRLGHANQNIFTVLAHARNKTIMEIEHLETELRNQILRLFISLKDQVNLTASLSLQRYISDLANGIRGNAEWGQRAERYLSHQMCDETSQLKLTNWVDSPAASDTDYLAELPAISWWRNLSTEA